VCVCVCSVCERDGEKKDVGEIQAVKQPSSRKEHSIYHLLMCREGGRKGEGEMANGKWQMKLKVTQYGGIKNVQSSWWRASCCRCPTSWDPLSVFAFI